MTAPDTRVSPPGYRADGGPRRRLTPLLLAVWGPGLIVMLADTDAGCIITAAQSGAQFGYSMVLPQVVLCRSCSRYRRSRFVSAS